MPVPPTPPDAAAGLGGRVLALIDRNGSPEERRLVAPHRDALLRFLNHPDSNPLARRHKLDIGLENRLTLKFNLIAGRKASPWGVIDLLAELAPALREPSEFVLRHKLQCHAGLKVTATGVEYELYPYETAEGLLAGTLCKGRNIADTGLPCTPYCYGFSSDGTLSAYAEITDVSIAELESAIGFGLPATNLKARALFHSRQDKEGKWLPGKAGIEFLPFPSHVLNTVLTHFNLHFSYLLHRGGRRPYGVIGAKGPRQVLYTTLLPELPAREAARE